MRVNSILMSFLLFFVDVTPPAPHRRFGPLIKFPDPFVAIDTLVMNGQKVMIHAVFFGNAFSLRKASHRCVRVAIFASLFNCGRIFFEGMVASNAGNLVFHGVGCVRKCH